MLGEHRRGLGLAVITLLATSVSLVDCTNILLVENGTTVDDDARLSVGNATDFFVEFLCIGEGSASSLWVRRRPSFLALPTPFDQTTTSYDGASGRARVFIDYIQDPGNLVDEGLLALLCFRSSLSANVDLAPVPNLFFSGEFPATVSSTEELSSACSSLLPNLPLFTVAAVTTGSEGGVEYGVCEIESARGKFRSSSVAVGEREPGTPLEPEFIAEPLNVTVQSINGVTRGAFSCVVYPSSVVESIDWFFQARASDEPVAVNIGDPDIRVGSSGGTSVLVLDNVGVEQEGFYYCEVTLVDSSPSLTSKEGYLEFNGTASDVNDVIILAPPLSLMEREGNPLLVPCVGSTEAAVFSGEPSSGGNTSLFGLTLTADRLNNGVITCAVGNDTEEVNVSVLAGVQFEQELEQEVVRFINTDPSPLDLECEASGNPLPSLSFLFNNKPITPSELVTVETQEPSCSVCVRRVLRLTQPTAADQGIYQCLAQVGEDASTAIVSTSYLNIQFLGSPTIFYDNSPVIESLFVVVDFLKGSETVVNLTCSVDTHPIASVSWSRNDSVSAAGTQSISGFREPAVSMLSVSLESGVGVSLAVTCIAELMDQVDTTTITITTYTPVVISEQPQTTPPLMIGETAVFTCIARSIPIPSITWFQFMNGMETQLMDNAEDILIMSERVNGTSMRSTLQLLISDAEALASGYLCRGDNGFNNTASDIAVIEPAMIPSIIRDPVDIIAVDGEVVEFNCSASGSPTPNVTWDTTPTLSPPPTFISTPVGDGMVESVLSIEAVEAINQTTFQCVARNEEGTASSIPAILIIAGPPDPSVLTVDPGTHSADLEWTTPFSLLPITLYTVEVFTDSSIVSSEEVTPPAGKPPPTYTQILEPLTPFTQYTVTVTALSRAGSSMASRDFTTLQAVPEAPPANVVAVAIDTVSIRLSWEAPSLEFRNGAYLVTYAPVSNSSAMTEVPTTRTERVITAGIEPGTAYSFSVQAQTIGLGPASDPIVQCSYPLPPNLLEDSPRHPDNIEVTTTTIPFLLPTINVSQFSHVWVVAVRLSGSDTPLLMEAPSNVFPDNSSFSTYPPSLGGEAAYIVSEMSAASYEAVSSEVFVLGDEEGTADSNDFPLLYMNGPLQEGTSYSLFVWAFIPAIPPSSEPVARRQTEGSRQYTVYASSGFASSATTSTRDPTGGDDLSAAVIAGIVIAIIVLLLLLALLVVLSIVICNMWYRQVKDIGPPPSRVGSRRFRDRGTGGDVTIVSNPTHTRDTRPRPDSALQENTSDDIRLPVAVKDFPEHVRKLHANSDHPFSEEYQLITIKSPGLPHLQGSAPYNVMKNRYANINAYDETRVCLSLIPGVQGSDYINANYIEGYQKKVLYVAAQGPLPNTVHDFWRMVWEEDSCCIIMLTNLNEKGRVKCHQYWPETGSLGLGDMTISVIDMQELAYYSIRTFRVSTGTERREVKQFHYTGWPDFGVPDHPHPVLSFIKRLNNFKRTTQGPDIMHCSAGVGRTGTLITIQSIMQMMEEEEKVDIFNFILGMRRQRSYLVQTERQYIFIHDAVVELIRMGNTEVSIQNLRKTYKELQAQNPHSETSHLEEEYLKLNSMPKMDPSMFSYATNALNTSKNRHPDIVPLDMYRVRLIMAPGIQCSDYINASYVDGYQRRHQYVLTQAPMSSTVDDFWRMIWEHSVSCVLMLCQNEEKGEEMCAEYWSKDKLKQHGDLFVELSQEVTYTNYTMREFSITNTKINESRILKHYQYTEWTEDTVPSNSAAIIDLVGVMQKAQHQNGGGPIVLHDSTPIGRAGTFCVLSSVLEQLKVEGVVDLFFFIHTLRQQQPGMVATFDQYKFCYTSVLEFLDSFDHYSNFD